MRTVIRVADYLKSAGTRGRGMQFFPTLEEAVKRAPSGERIVISFENVEFVSTSFLEETVLRLLTDDKKLGDRLVIEDLQPFVSERVRSRLSRMNQDPAIVSGARIPEPA
ncbi:MAG: STAS-like domain-containing protein [Gammaproteobacteria bacterium]